MSQFHFPKSIDHGHIVVGPTHVMVSCGWTVYIPMARALSYAEKGPGQSAQGFRLHAGHMILTHRGNSVTLPEETGLALIDAIKTARHR